MTSSRGLGGGGRAGGGAQADLPTIPGPRVTLRPVERSDIDRLLEIIREPSVARWWGDYDRERVLREFVAGTAFGHVPVRSFAIDLGGETTIGAVQYHEEPDPDYRHAGMDIFIASRYQGEGLGPEALWLLARHLFEEVGHHRLVMDPAAENERAIKAYERVGFKRVGVMRAYERRPDGKFHDNLLMEMLAGDLRPV